jgi:HK97 family phage prohead protease
MGQWEIGNSRELLNFVRKELCLHGSEGGIRGVDDGLCVELFAAAPFFCRITEEGNLDHGIKWTFSTFDLDRYCERIDPAGWDFKRYMDNPVVEWSHRYDIPAIGRADSLCADEKGLHGLVIFNSRDYDPFGWAIGERVKAGVIKAGSVGFRPIEIEVPNKETAKDGTSLIFRKQELLEFSICNVPANPWALAKALAFNKVDDRKQERELSPFWGNVIKN